MSNAENTFYNNQPPTVTGTTIVQSTAAGITATSFDWTAALTPAVQGTVQLTLEALAQNVYVRFGPTSTTGTTANNGRTIVIGSPQKFYVSPVSHRFIDLLGAAAAGTLKVQVSSPYGERLAQ